MMYSKGDTIEIALKRMLIVLNDGIRGPEFVEQYAGQEIPYFSSFIRTLRGSMVGTSWTWSPNTTIHEVYYYVLVGDMKGWIEERRLVVANRGRHKKSGVQ